MRPVLPAILTTLLLLLGSGSGRSAESDGSATAVAPAPDTARPVADWIAVARAETAEQRREEAADPGLRAILAGAGKYVSFYGGHAAPPTPPEFIAWWKETGAAGLERWVADGFPDRSDRFHLVYSAMALAATHHTPAESTSVSVNGRVFPDAKPFRAYLARIKSAGMDAMRRGCSGLPLHGGHYLALRLYAPLSYSIWAAPYLPFELGLTGGNMHWLPTPGMRAPEVVLPRLETVLRSPAYTDAYDFDYVRPFRSELAGYLLGVCAGYEAIPPAERKPDGPTVRPRPQPADPEGFTLSSLRGKKPVMLVFTDPIDGYWAATIPLMEPLYRATRDRIDWYIVADSIGDAIYWSDYYIKPSHGYQRLFQKAITLEERAQGGKMMLMRFANVSIPMLLDDMAQHAQDAYSDQGGIAKAILIDRDGTICLNNRLWRQPYDYTHQGEFGFQHLTQAHAVLAANVRRLLDHDGRWDGKPATLPDWQPPPRIEGATIAAIDHGAGTVTVRAANGKEAVAHVDAGTRIVFAEAPAQVKALGDLAVGAPVSLTFDGSPRTARLVVKGATIKAYLGCFDAQTRPWCPAVATANDGKVLTAALAPRPREELVGLRFWDEAGARAQPFNDGWMLPYVRDWAARPDQELRFHLDRATEVLIDGMRGTVADIVPGDRLGVEIRKDQKPDALRPCFIFVYRQPTAGGAPAAR